MAQHSINSVSQPVQVFYARRAVSFYTFSILVILLLKVCLQRAPGYRSAAIFISGCALLVFMSALRWQFDAVILRQLQSIVAIALPPLAWRCFARLTTQSRPQKFPRYLIAPPDRAAAQPRRPNDDGRHTDAAVHWLRRRVDQNRATRGRCLYLHPLTGCRARLINDIYCWLLSLFFRPD